MRIHAISIKPLSPFGTPLKADTIFGHFCWQAAEDPGMLTGGLAPWIACYGEQPFAVFSSAWPKVREGNSHLYAIRRPELPLCLLGDPYQQATCKERLDNRKKNKGRKWLLVGEDLTAKIDWQYMLGDRELYERHLKSLPIDWRKRLRLAPAHQRRPISSFEQQHNTINRLTMTTGKGDFAPYSMINNCFMPEMEFVIFAGLNEDACDSKQLREAFARIGQWGFGRDASTGMGRFTVTAVEEITLPVPGKNDVCLTLGPCVPEKNYWQKMYCTPFTRFGRHGAQMLQTGKPFKNPVVMADEGAVFVPSPGKYPSQPYIGCAVTNISKAQSEAVCQGYSLYLPMQMPATD